MLLYFARLSCLKLQNVDERVRKPASRKVRSASNLLDGTCRHNDHFCVLVYSFLEKKNTVKKNARTKHSSCTFCNKDIYGRFID